jgi:predicted permease
MLADIVADVQFALRQLRKAPAFTAAVALTLALGIGANSAIYSVTDAAVFRPVRYRQPEQLISVWAGSPGEARFYSFSYPRFEFFRERSREFAALAAYDDETVTLVDAGEPVRLTGGRVSANFFSVLGVAPALGRGFLPEEDAHNARPVVLLSDGCWRRRYNGDPQVLNRAVRIDGEEFMIVGVLPAGFQFRDPDVELWRSRIVDTRTFAPESVRLGAGYLTVLGRLQKSLSVSEVQARFAAIDESYRRDHPGNSDIGDRAFSDLLERQFFPGVRKMLIMIWGAVGCLLLIACANVANLVLARNSARQRECAVRLALGAGRLRIARQLITEGLVLSLLGGIASVPVTAWSMPLVAAGVQRTMSAVPDPHLDLRLLAITFAIAALIGTAFGLAPLLLLMRGELEGALHSGGRTASSSAWSIRYREALVAGQVALCVILLTGAASLLDSFRRMSAARTDLRVANVSVVPLDLMPDRYQSWDSRGRFYAEVLRRTSEIPGVTSTAITSRIDLIQHGLGYMISVEGRPDLGPGNPGALGRSVSPNYFNTLGISLLRGRGINERDSVTAPRVMVVNETFGRQFFPGQDPLGKHVTYSTDRIRCEIVGVVRDVRVASQADTEPTMYLPLAQRPWLVARLLVRTGSPNAVLVSVRNAIQAVNPDQAVGQARPLDDMISDALGQPRTTMFLVMVFAVLALALGAFGIYGVTAYTVAQRGREIAIRMALGADARGVRGLVFRQTVQVLAAGLLVGIPLAAAVSRVYANMLFGMHSADPAMLAAVGAAVGLVAIAASSVPAIQAAAIDPIASLRAE